LLDNMFRHRHEVFVNRLRWVAAAEDGLERDEFDELRPIYVLALAEEDRVIGSCRLLPSTGPTMLGTVFRHALHGRPCPEDPRLWEVSRLAAPGHCDPATSLGELANVVISAAARVVEANGGTEFLAFSDLSLERKIRAHGIPVQRLAPPVDLNGLTCIAYTTPTDPW
jgi:N-acyl-L-homoserine lactone synthetase